MSASVVIFVSKRGLLACVLNMRTICMVFVANGWFDTGFYDHVGHKPMKNPLRRHIQITNSKEKDKKLT